MYTYISEHKFLRKEKNYGVCYDERLDYCLNVFYKIPIEDFYLLTLFDSFFTDEQIIQIIDKSNYGDKNGTSWFKYLTECYGDILSKSDVKGKRKQIIKVNGYLDDDMTCELVNKLSFPIMASIRLNNYCDSKCKYCFNHSNRTNISQLEYEDVKNILEQLYKGGATTLNITGGDPLCHPDIVKILQLIISYGFSFKISTKKILNHDFVKQLKEIGLKGIQISIDSCDDSLNGYLLQKKDYYSKQKEAIQELVDYGIEVDINCVVNALNIKGIERLLLEANNLGVTRLTLTPYLSVNREIDQELMTAENEIYELEQMLEKYRNLAITWEFAIPEQDESYSFYDGEHNICSGGRMSIVVNHDGNVTICERLTDNPDFVVGNIRSMSIADIWNSNNMKVLTHPQQEKFYGTSCWQCTNYEHCILKKGPCYARISKISNRKYECDPFCNRSSKKVRFH